MIVFDPHLKGSAILFWLNGAVATMALVGWKGLSGPLRRHPEPAAFVITLAMAGATAATGIVEVSLASESIGYLLVFPGLIALILPWQTRTHVRWLVAYGVIALGFLMYETPGGPSTDERGDLIVVALIALLASFVGHVLLQRAQIQNFSHVQRIQALRRRADADMQELARVHRALETTARTDPLTGAANRIRLAEDLLVVRSRLDRQAALVRPRRHRSRRFKLINDRFGHLAGDAVLRRVVAAARATLRPTDSIYRFGGEEFLVLLENATPRGPRRGHRAASRRRPSGRVRASGQRPVRRRHDQPGRGPADAGGPRAARRRLVRTGRRGPLPGQGRRPQPRGTGRLTALGARHMKEAGRPTATGLHRFGTPDQIDRRYLPNARSARNALTTRKIASQPRRSAM